MYLFVSLALRISAITILLILISFIVYKIIWTQLKQRKCLSELAQRGFAPAPTLHSSNFLRTSVLKDSIKATQQDRGPQYIVSAMNSVGINVHTLRVPILNYELLVTRDPENVKAMFSTQSSDYDISSTRANSFMPLLGEGIFTSTGAQWRHSRALVRPQFTHEEVSNLGMIDAHVEIMLQMLKVGSDKWTKTVDLQPLFFYFTLDTATEFLYGQSVHSQTAVAGLQKSSSAINGAAFSHHFSAAKHLVDKRGALGKFCYLMPIKELRIHCAKIHDAVDTMICERLNSKKSIDEKARKFVLLDELAKETQNPRELRNETLHVLMAGRDPTGALLGWVFYFLSRNASVFDKLRSRILCQFSGKYQLDINLAQLRRCEYLQWVMNEVIRIVAIIPMNERVAIRDTTLPRGGGDDGSRPIFVRKGVQILIPLYAIQHRPDIWGDDAEEFKPERWEGRRTGWEWIPFGGGARKCLGREFSLSLGL
jgi:cytochrome P450